MVKLNCLIPLNPNLLLRLRGKLLKLLLPHLSTGPSGREEMEALEMENSDSANKQLLQQEVTSPGWRAGSGHQQTSGLGSFLKSEWNFSESPPENTLLNLVLLVAKTVTHAHEGARVMKLP